MCIIIYLLWLNQVILFATSPVQVKQKHSKLKSIEWYGGICVFGVWINIIVYMFVNTFICYVILLYTWTWL